MKLISGELSNIKGEIIFQAMAKNFDLILRGEDTFARAVALGLWVKRPISPWHYLLPGMFIFDYLRRSSAVRIYKETFLYPRKLALDLGLRLVKGEDRMQLLGEAEEIIRGWLSEIKMFSPKIQENHMEQIKILFAHYVRLLQAEGENYPDLIRNAYRSKRSYETFLEELTFAEKRVDEAIAEFFRETELIKRRLLSEQEQVALLRKKQVEQIFPEI